MAARVLTQADAMELKKINVGITGGETGNRDLAESRQGMSLRAQPKFTSCRLQVQYLGGLVFIGPVLWAYNWSFLQLYHFLSLFSIEPPPFRS